MGSTSFPTRFYLQKKAGCSFASRSKEKPPSLFVFNARLPKDFLPFMEAVSNSVYNDPLAAHLVGKMNGLSARFGCQMIDFPLFLSPGDSWIWPDILREPASNEKSLKIGWGITPGNVFTELEWFWLANWAPNAKITIGVFEFLAIFRPIF